MGKVDERSALVYDLCLEASMSADEDNTLALVLQAWHPEVAALERTTFIREKSKSWNLDKIKDQEKSAAEAKEKEEEEKKKAEADADGNLQAAREEVARKRAEKELE